METIEQIFFRKINPSDFRNMYSVAVPSSGGGQTYIEAAGIPDDALLSFLDYAEMIAPTSKQETRMAFRFNCYMVNDPEKYDFIEFQPRRGRNYRIVRQTENHRHPAWSVANGFPAPQKDGNGAYVDDSSFTGIIDNLLVAIIRTSYRKYYAWFVNESTIPTNWPNGVGLEKMFSGDKRGILIFEDVTLRFVPNATCPFELNGSGVGRLVSIEPIDGSYQRITYGAPGTGKSHSIEEVVKAYADTVRTTFHPDSDYATFVGCYKPTMKHEKKTYILEGKEAEVKGEDGNPVLEDRIVYDFVPQAFTKTYVRAWRKMVPGAEGKIAPQFLVIEEINRGNCAQIFGDLFQLLDRDGAGYSKYAVEADSDLAKHIAKELVDISSGIPSEICSGKILKLPPNLYIWATMNTSDQSLFPIDSAFKRRWDWEYVPIAKPDKSDDPDWKDRKIEIGDSLFDWWEFLTAINGHIAKATESEDKQLGYFFVKADDATGYISAEQFANKVLFYLYGDVFKSYERPKENCFRDLSFRDFFYSEKTEIEQGDGTKVEKKPGDVKLDVVAGFLNGLKWEGKGVTCVQKPVAAATTSNETAEASSDSSAASQSETQG